MSGPQISIVITPGDAVQRLRMSVKSAVAAGEACGAPFEIIVALADADAPTREVAAALDHPRLRLSPASAAITRSAAELAWGETVILLKGGDLLSPAYVDRLARQLSKAEGAETIARPAACVTYGGSPSMRSQTSLGGGASDRGRLLFAAPFAPPIAAARALLVRLPPRPWSTEADWAWTARTSAEGVHHGVAEGAAYVAWSPPAAPLLELPSLGDEPRLTAATPSLEPASEAEVAALLYARAANARMGEIEAALKRDELRFKAQADEAERLQTALDEALAESDKARRRAESLQTSTSWKATAPLRALVSFVKPGGRL